MSVDWEWKCGVAQDRCRKLEAEIDGLLAAARAYRDLCTRYRTGTSPRDALHKRLDAARKTLLLY